MAKARHCDYKSSYITDCWWDLESNRLHAQRKWFASGASCAPSERSRRIRVASLPDVLTKQAERLSGYLQIRRSPTSLCGA